MDEGNLGCKCREDWKKDNRQTEKNGDWESEDVKDIKTPIHTHNKSVA
jgi:hypothetical protein